jgi:hypothetical protein
MLTQDSGTVRGPVPPALSSCARCCSRWWSRSLWTPGNAPLAWLVHEALLDPDPAVQQFGRDCAPR